jgi:hypothetical protein
MNRISSPTRSIVPRPPPTTMSMRARREIDEIYAPSVTSGEPLFPCQPAVFSPFLSNADGPMLPAVHIDVFRAEAKTPMERAHRDFVQPQF